MFRSRNRYVRHEEGITKPNVDQFLKSKTTPNLYSLFDFFASSRFVKTEANLNQNEFTVRVVYTLTSDKVCFKQRLMCGKKQINQETAIKHVLRFIQQLKKLTEFIKVLQS